MGFEVVTIHQPNYIPWMGFFHKACHADVLVLLDDVQYSKNSVQNRNKVRTRDGEVFLTVPVLTSGHFGQKTNQVLIDMRSNWQSKHLKTIQLNYGKSPYYHLYEKDLLDFYSRPYEKLVDACVDFIHFVVQWLNLPIHTVLASELGVEAESTERLILLTKKIGGRTYLSGPSGGHYLQKEAFADAGLELQFHQFQHPQYSQFNGEQFILYLSVLDVIFNCGYDSRQYLLKD